MGIAATLGVINVQYSGLTTAAFSPLFGAANAAPSEAALAS